MAIQLNTIKALTFDIGGTVFDWHQTLCPKVDCLSRAHGVEVDAAAFTNQWRRRMFELLAQVRSGELPWMNADDLHRRALDDLVGPYPALHLTSSEKDELTHVWHRLQAWADAPPALERLRSCYTVVVLTVLSWAIAIDSSKVAGINWDGVLSCEFLGHYKPDVEAYQAGVRVLGIAPHEAIMVAAHPGDLRAAAAAGLYTAYIPRPGEKGVGNDLDLSPQPDFDINVTDFGDLVQQLVG